MNSAREVLDWLYIQEAYEILTKTRKSILTHNIRIYTKLKEQFTCLVSDSNTDDITNFEFLILVGIIADIFKMHPKPLDSPKFIPAWSKYLDDYYARLDNINKQHPQ